MTEYAPRRCGIFMGSKSQALELRKVESEGYEEGDESDAVEMAGVMVKSGEPVSQWAIWDNRTDAPAKRQDKPYSAREFAALVKGEDVALVWCKRGQFRAPVLKVGQLDAKATAKGKRAAPQRFGK